MIAGYHWFTDWGRDTMISLEGLTLRTGRHAEAGYILRTFAHYIRDGLIPNLFPEGQNEGLYHTADATLWFFHALDRYLEATGDRDTLRHAAAEAARHRRAPPARARVSASASIPPTACCARGPRAISSPGWTPRWATGSSRRGAARRWRSTPCGTTPCGCSRAGSREEGDAAAAAASREHAERARESFNRRFWYAEGGYLYDVVDGEQGDDACLPAEPGASRSRCRTRCSTDALGGGARGRRASGCSRRSGCARWRPGIPTTSRSTTATCAPATPPITRARSGPG